MSIINVNEAGLTSLVQLKGIGESKAKAIIAWREEHGPFETVDELLSVNGIGESTLESIRKQVSLE
ncbi:helix-hairpin-helix domain-containing protein [Gilvimarinus agarilyticus]|nr:helix-hairpin-helix domain-containing protein [Gilvimarinus agarilyticus]